MSINLNITTNLRQALKAMGYIEKTYSELASLISSSSLKKGSFYKITDFETKHYFLSGNTTLNTQINTGTAEPLIVLATDSNKLSNIAFSLTHPDDIIHYDWNPDNWLTDISFSYLSTIITGFKGVIYYREDAKQNISTHYDWRNVKLRRWELNPATWDIGTTYNQYDIVKGSNGKVYYSIGGSNLNNDPTTNEFTLWRPLIDFDITGLYLSLTETSYRIEHYVDGAVRNFDIPCSANYEDYLTFGNAALDEENIYLKIGARAFKSTGNYYTIINNLLINISSRSSSFSYVVFDGLCFNSTIHGTEAYFWDFGRYFYNNLILINTTDVASDLHNPNGGFFRNVVVNPSRNTYGVDYYLNIVCADNYQNQIERQVWGNYYGRNLKYNTFEKRHNRNIWGSNIQVNKFGSECTENYNELGEFYGSEFSNNFKSNTIDYGAGEEIRDCYFGLNFNNNTIHKGFEKVKTGIQVNNNTFNGQVQEVYLGTTTDYISFRDQLMRNVVFTDNWKLGSAVMDLTGTNVLYSTPEPVKTVFANAGFSGLGDDRYILKYMLADFSIKYLQLKDNTVKKTL